MSGDLPKGGGQDGAAITPKAATVLTAPHSKISAHLPSRPVKFKLALRRQREAKHEILCCEMSTLVLH